MSALFDYTTAKDLADELLKIMQPFCSKIEIAGSLRRKKERVKDIEICLVPENKNKLFNVLGNHLLSSNKNFQYLKNGERYKQFLYKEIKVDLFIAREDNWGIIYLVRTGSAEFSTRILSTWKKVSKGGYSKDGYLYNSKNEMILTPEEADVFTLCNLEFVAPEFRE